MKRTRPIVTEVMWAHIVQSIIHANPLSKIKILQLRYIREHYKHTTIRTNHMTKLYKIINWCYKHMPRRIHRRLLNHSRTSTAVQLHPVPSMTGIIILENNWAYSLNFINLIYINQISMSSWCYLLTGRRWVLCLWSTIRKFFYCSHNKICSYTKLFILCRL